MSLALASRAVLTNWPSHSGQYKVTGLLDFSSGNAAIERSVLDLRGLPECDLEALTSLPWMGFLANHQTRVPPGRAWMLLQGPPDMARSGDVLEVQPVASRVAIRYRRGGNGNVLFATERCDNYCLMCSQPPRQVADGWRLSKLRELVELIDADEVSLAISGGEPTLLEQGLADLVRHCAVHLPRTQLHVLSNGRAFSDPAYANSFAGIHPRLSWGIPLYGDNFALHDYVVQRVGAFAETLRGLYALERAGQRVEIRVVLVKPTVERLAALARFIYHNLPFVDHVALMGIEPIGFAKANREALWIDPVDMAAALLDSVRYLNRHLIPVSLYNLPLCTIPRELWPFTKRSISDWKQDYLPECASCVVKEQCGGFFSWVTDEWRSRSVKSISEVCR